MVLIYLLLCVMASVDWRTGLGSFLSRAEGARKILNAIWDDFGFLILLLLLVRGHASQFVGIFFLVWVPEPGLVMVPDFALGGIILSG